MQGIPKFELKNGGNKINQFKAGLQMDYANFLEPTHSTRIDILKLS